MIDQKLGNRQVLAKAPPEVVESQHGRRAEAAQFRDKLAAALARLAGWVSTSHKQRHAATRA